MDVDGPVFEEAPAVLLAEDPGEDAGRGFDGKDDADEGVVRDADGVPRAEVDSERLAGDGVAPGLADLLGLGAQPAREVARLAPEEDDALAQAGDVAGDARGELRELGPYAGGAVRELVGGGGVGEGRVAPVEPADAARVDLGEADGDLDGGERDVGVEPRAVAAGGGVDDGDERPRRDARLERDGEGGALADEGARQERMTPAAASRSRRSRRNLSTSALGTVFV